MSVSTRVKFGYLTEDDMKDKIESGVLDAYDIVYTKDTRLCYILDSECNPQVVRSRVQTFDSTSDAAVKLNSSEDTYEGQIVSILHGDVYRAYIVRKNNNQFVVVPVSQLSTEVDFNDLLNRPITNLVGTFSQPIIIGNQLDGVYGVKGQYQLFSTVATLFSGLSTDIFIKEGNTITKYSAGEITKYTPSTVNNPDHYVTEQTLQDYATIQYVQDYLEEIHAVTEENVEEVVNNIISNSITDTVNELIDVREATTAQIDGIFTED